MKKQQRIYSVATIVIIIDIITKLLVNIKLQENDIIKVIPNFFSIYFLKNTGAAFSMFEDSTIFLVILSTIIIIMLDKFIKKEENLSIIEEISFGLVLGGIFGNMIDRIINHSVTDYLSFKIFKYNFPVFNIADICITIGAVILIISILKNSKARKESR